MDYDDSTERQRKIAAMHAAQAAQRKAFLQTLMGSADVHDWQAPPPVEDFEKTLGEHAAQLRNAARYLMGKVLLEGAVVAETAGAASALTRLIQTNIAIAKVLNTREPRPKSKTVRGGASPKGPQD